MASYSVSGGRFYSSCGGQNLLGSRQNRALAYFRGVDFLDQSNADNHKREQHHERRARPATEGRIKHTIDQKICVYRHRANNKALRTRRNVASQCLPEVTDDYYVHHYYENEPNQTIVIQSLEKTVVHVPGLERRAGHGYRHEPGGNVSVPLYDLLLDCRPNKAPQFSSPR